MAALEAPLHRQVRPRIFCDVTLCIRICPQDSVTYESRSFFAVCSALPGVAAVIAVCRAKRDDLPDVVRALMRMGPRDDKRDDDARKPPSLPQS
jgi:hypothetical protein